MTLTELTPSDNAATFNQNPGQPRLLANGWFFDGAESSAQKSSAQKSSSQKRSAQTSSSQNGHDPSPRISPDATWDAIWLEDSGSAQAATRLKQRAAALVRRYVRTPSQQLAEQVAACFAVLAWHPDVCRDPSGHCAYRGMVRHWMWLAGQRSGQPVCQPVGKAAWQTG